MSIATHSIPFGLVILIFLLALPACAFAGFHLGSHERNRDPARYTEGKMPGEASLGALLALLGLLLGFTFSAVLGWREASVSAVVEEAAALGTAFLRADMLPEAEGRPLQQALLGYARTRIVPSGYHATRENVDAFVAHSTEAQAALWPTTMAALTPEVPAPVSTYVAGGITEVLDAHTRRVAAASKSITSGIWMLLTFAAGSGLFIIGNRAALQGRRLSWRTLVFSLVLTAVLVTIEDLSRASDGFTVVPQTPLVAAVADMESALGTAALARATPRP
ncbi:hypothetical protein CLG85_013230 [Yangia mangrovi]|uniref:DUF4239 domain-containing protein n=1 Tax=Alloyangia mangrovi TaxID=1779329 RepID=A0A2A3JVP2_9RHOB|nr:hypothetical protein [Alloyangia mangrovi]MCA0938370.1 hypothetical protein [Alloyangia pacifica]MCA0943728.1 hypothetical protein [Alloyangia pacifica]MCT4371227.1 hypothetical protein [Alloyangia mangrovi]